MKELLERLNQTTPWTERSYEWPRTARALGEQLTRYAPNLRRVGVEVQRPARTNRGYPVRITTVQPQPDPQGE
jgi:hypothetical protein